MDGFKTKIMVPEMARKTRPIIIDLGQYTYMHMACEVSGFGEQCSHQMASKYWRRQR